jgi:hypothetical protein
MLRYIVSRVLIAASERRTWFLFPVVITVAFFLASYIRADRFVISSSIPVPDALEKQAAGAGGDPKSFVLNAVGVGSYAREALGAEAFFGAQAFYAYVQSQHEAEELGVSLETAHEGNGPQWREDEGVRGLVRSLSLSLPDTHAILLKYDGPDRDVGERIVRTLASRIGARLNGFAAGTAGAQGTVAVSVAPVRFHLPAWVFSGGLLILVVGGLLTFVLVGVLEMSSPTLSSETQLGRYLGLPVLGMVPRVRDPRAGEEPRETKHASSVSADPAA